MSIYGDITSARIEMRRLDARDVIRLADSRHVLRDVGPGCASVFTDLNVTVVRANPDYSGKFWPRGNSYHITVSSVTVVLRGRRILAGDAHNRKRGAIDLLAEIDGCGPGVAAVQRLEEFVTACVNQSWILRRNVI